MEAARVFELASFQRRVRHISEIRIRNVAVPLDDAAASRSRCWLAFFTLSTDKVLYQSELTRCYKNASWRAVNIGRRTVKADTRGSVVAVDMWARPLVSAREFDVGISDTKPSTEGFTLVKRFVVDLFALALLQQTPEGIEAPFEYDNTLLMALGSSWYYAAPMPKIEEKQRPLPRYLRAAVSGMRRIYTEGSLSRIISLCSALQQVRKAELDQLQGSEAWLSQQRTRMEQTRARVAHLQLRLSHERKKKDTAAKERAAKQRQLEDKRATMERRYVELDENICVLNQRKEAFIAREHKVNEMLLARDMRQAVLVLELYSVYHVKPITEDLCSIMGIELPNGTFTDGDDDAVATALGYVAHLVVMMSKYLQLPLRYPLKLLGSRSSVVDNISFDRSDRPRRFPLYPRVKDRSLFERGVFLLNKDVQQLLEHHGVGVRDALATLPNIRRLMLLLYDFTKQHNPATQQHAGP